MSALCRLILIAVLLLTSQGLAAARGQARIAGEMVFCAGGQTVTLQVDEDGQPVKRLLICPDMALGLMAAVANVAVLPRLADRVQLLPRTAPDAHSHGREAPISQARDPPRSLVA